MAYTMFDSVTVSAIPAGGDATAGYVNGRYANSAQMRRAFPTLPHLSIAVFASVDAMALDVEPGDARIDQAPGWCDRQHTRGLAWPILYTSASQIGALRATMGGRQYLLWSAHYTGVAHICGGSCGYPAADATQWTDHGPHGENVDISLLSDRFFTAIGGVIPQPAPPASSSPAPLQPTEGTDMARIVLVQQKGHPEIYVSDLVTRRHVTPAGLKIALFWMIKWGTPADEMAVQQADNLDDWGVEVHP